MYWEVLAAASRAYLGEEKVGEEKRKGIRGSTQAALKESIPGHA